MFRFLKRSERIFLAYLFFLASISLIVSDFVSITGNLISNQASTNFSINYFGLFFLLISFLLFLSDKKSLEAIVVPTGPAGKIDEQRAIAGAKVYSQHPQSKVIISGILNDGKFLSSQSSTIYRTLRRNGVERADIIFEPESKDTAENVINTSRILDREGFERVIVVTDSDHAKRIKMLFGRARQEGLLKSEVEVDTYTFGIDRAYGSVKANLAYLKDRFRPL